MTTTKTKASLAFTVDAAHLAQRLSCVAGMIARRSTIPVLNCVLMTLKAGLVTLKGSNMDQLGEVSVTADMTRQGGGFCIEAAKLGEFVKRVSGPLTIELDGDKARLSCGRARAEIGTLPAHDFAALTFPSGVAEYEVAAAKLSAGLSAVAYAASPEETRYYLRGIHMMPTKRGLRLDATDGKRAAMLEIEDMPPGMDFGSVIIPRDSIAYCIAACDRAGETIRLSVGEGRIRLSSENESLISKLIDGSFPDVDRIYPVDGGEALTMPADDLARAVDLAAASTEGRSPAVRFDTERGRMVCTGRGESNWGEAAIEAPGIVAVESFVLNGRFVADALAACKGGEVTLRYFGDAAPVRVDGAANGLRQVIMPFRG